MEQEQYRREVQEAIDAADRALYSLERARKSLGSARGWGIYDMFAGGFVSIETEAGKNQGRMYRNERTPDGNRAGPDGSISETQNE